MTTEIFIDRSQFGSGKAGKRAYTMIASGIACDHCGVTARKTIDFHIPTMMGVLEQIPVCEPCSPIVQEIIVRDLEGRDDSISFNGRSRA